MNHTKMTARELAQVLNVHEKTVKSLAKTGQIPCLYQNKRIYFNFFEVIRYLKNLEEKNTLKGTEGSNAFLFRINAITA